MLRYCVQSLPRISPFIALTSVWLVICVCHITWFCLSWRSLVSSFDILSFEDIPNFLNFKFKQFYIIMFAITMSLLSKSTYNCTQHTTVTSTILIFPFSPLSKHLSKTPVTKTKQYYFMLKTKSLSFHWRQRTKLLRICFQNFLCQLSTDLFNSCPR